MLPTTLPISISPLPTSIVEAHIFPTFSHYLLAVWVTARLHEDSLCGVATPPDDQENRLKIHWELLIVGVIRGLVFNYFLGRCFVFYNFFFDKATIHCSIL